MRLQGYVFVSAGEPGSFSLMAHVDCCSDAGQMSTCVAAVQAPPPHRCRTAEKCELTKRGFDILDTNLTYHGLAFMLAELLSPLPLAFSQQRSGL